jgi:hypothetical protein
VPRVPAVRAAEVPPGGLGRPPGAVRAGGGRAPLVDKADSDPGGLGLVFQGADEVADPPVPGPLIVMPPRVLVQDAARVADRQRPDPVLHRPRHDGLGGLMLGLPDPPQVPGLSVPLPALVPPPAARPALPRPGGAAGRGPGAALAVAQVLPALGADGPSGDQQPLISGAGDGVGVDDAQVHARDPRGVGPGSLRVGRHGDLGGHVQVQAAGVEPEGHRPDLTGSVGHVPVQANQQRRAPSGGREAQHPPVQGERARVPADGHKAAPPPREPRRGVPRPAPRGGREPGVGVAAQHRPGPDAVELAEGARPRRRQFPAQFLVARQRGALAAAPPPVQLQHGAPHIARRPQQPEQPVPLGAGHPQPAPGGPVHRRRRIPLTFSRHEPMKPDPTDKTAPPSGNSHSQPSPIN